MTNLAQLYDLIKETFLLLDFGDRQFLEQFDLTVPRYYALVHIATEPGLSPSRLSRFMFCDKSNVTRLVQSLEGQGLVERRPDGFDGRVQQLYLTAAGAARYTTVAAAHDCYVTQRLGALDAAQVEGISEGLGRLNHALAASIAMDKATALN